MINYLKNKLGVVDFANAQGLVNIVKNYYSKETVEQWPMYTLYKVRVKQQQFDEFFKKNS